MLYTLNLHSVLCPIYLKKVLGETVGPLKIYNLFYHCDNNMINKWGWSIDYTNAS